MGIQLDVVTNTKKSESDLKKVELAVNGISKSVDSAIGSLKNFASGIALSVGGLGLVATFVRVSDSISNLDTKLRISTKNQLDYERALSSVNKTAIDTRQSISDVASLYSKLNLNAGELQASQQSIATVTDAISKSIALSGASAETAAAGLSQLAQGLASGQLAGDELRSVLENTPRLARAIADGLGVSIGQLRDLGAAGKLTSKEVFGSILSQTYKLNAEFGKVSITYSQAFQNIRNSGTILFQSLSKAFNKPGSKGLPDFINNIATGITNFAVDIDLKILKLQGNIVRFADNTIEYLKKLPTELIKVFDQIAKYANTKIGSINPLKINVADFIKGLSDGESMVTNWVKKVEYQFFWLYDRVIGNSWIPDLVIGVTSWLGKLAGAPLGAITEFAKLASAAFSSISFQGIKDGLKSALLYASEVAGKINDYFGIYKTRVTYTAIGGVAGASAGGSSSGDPTTIAVEPSFWEKMKKSFQKGMESTDRGFFAYVKDINNSIKDFFNLGPNIRGPQRNNPDRPFIHDAINALPVQTQIPVIAAVTAGVIGLLYASTSGATLSVLAGLTTTAAGLVVGTSVYDSEIKRVSDKLVGMAHKVVGSIVEALFGSGIFGDKGFGGTLLLVAKMALLFKAGRELIGKGITGAAAAPTNLVNDATTRILARRSEGIYTRNNEELKESTKRLDGFKESIKRATDDIAQKTYRDSSGQIQKIGAVQANDLIKNNAAIPAALQGNQSLANAIRNSQAAAQLQAKDIKNTEEFIKIQSKKVDELKDVYSKLSSQASAASDRFRQGFLNTSSATGGIFGTLGGFKLGEEIAKGMTNSTEWEKVGVVIGTTMVGQGVGSAIGSAVGIGLLSIGTLFATLFIGGITNPLLVTAAAMGAAIWAAFHWEEAKVILNSIPTAIFNALKDGANFIARKIDESFGTKFEKSPEQLKNTPATVIQGIQSASESASRTLVTPSVDSTVAGTVLATKLYGKLFQGVGTGIVDGFSYFADKLVELLHPLLTAMASLKQDPTTNTDTIKKANGGYISGPGTGKSDSIPARLSNGEFVVNAKSTKKNRELLENINSSTVSKFATGGYVSGSGTGTSDSIPARLSNGEFVVNAKSTARNKILLEKINSDSVLKFADGGIVGRPTMVNDPRIVFSTDNLSKKIDDLANKLGENGNIASFIKLIAKLEGTGSYGFNTGFGNRQITDLSKFPYASRQFDISTGNEIPADQRADAPKGSTTSAAGLGQIIRDTYDRLSTKLGVNDFGPETQLRMIVELIKERGAYADVITGKFDTAVSKLGDEWEGFKKATPEKINKAIEAVKSGAGEMKDEAVGLFESFKKKLLELLSNSGLDSSIVDKILGFFGVIKGAASRILGVEKRPAPKSLDELATEVSQNSSIPISKDTLKEASAGVISSFVQTLDEIKKTEVDLTNRNLSEIGTTLLKKKLKELTDAISESVDSLTKPSRLPSKKILTSSGNSQLTELNKYLGDIGTPLTETTFKGLSPEEISQVADLIDQFADFSERSAKSSSIMKKSLQSTADNYADAIKSIVRRNEERLNEKEARAIVPSSTESKQAGEQFANQFHNDVYTGFRNVLLGQSDKPFFIGILDSFTAGIVDNFSKAFIDSLFKNFDVDKIVSSIGSGTFDFGGLVAKMFGTSKKDYIGDSSGSGSTPFDLLNGIEKVAVKKPDIQLNELEASFQQGYTYLANVFTNVGSGLSDGLMAIINAIQLAFTFSSAGDSGGFFSSIIGAVVKSYQANYGSANMSESFVNVNASGAFADGGVIPGNFGEPKLVVAHGGEVVLNNAQQRALLNGGTGGSQQTFHISITGDVSRQTRAEVLKLIPQIATGVNQANYEAGNARR